jgi:hypothetical protein
MHVTMGACDLAKVAWDAGTATLHGVGCRKAGAQGRILVHVPQGWQPAAGAVARLGRELVALDLAFTGREMPWQIAFTT